MIFLQGDEEGDPEDEEGPQADDAQVDAGHHPRVNFQLDSKSIIRGGMKQSFLRFGIRTVFTGLG